MWYDMSWYDISWFVMTRSDLTFRSDMTWYDWLLGEYALADIAYLDCLESHGGLVLCEDIEGGHQRRTHRRDDQEMEINGMTNDSIRDHTRDQGGFRAGGKGSEEGFVSAGPCLVSARALWLIESGRFEMLRDHLDECEHYYGLLADREGTWWYCGDLFW